MASTTASSTADTIDLFVDEPGTVEDLENRQLRAGANGHKGVIARRRAEQEAARRGAPLDSPRDRQIDQGHDLEDYGENDGAADTATDTAMSTLEYTLSTLLLLIIGALITLSQMLRAYEFQYENEHHLKHTKEKKWKPIGSEYSFTLWGSVAQVLFHSCRFLPYIKLLCDAPLNVFYRLFLSTLAS